jgi:hypothetical protein
MELKKFERTEAFRKLKYQRCWYLIRPCDSTYLGISARWIKAGISRTNLTKRLRAYQTYWPSGVEVIAVAGITQPEDSPMEMISVVEKYVLGKVKRVKPGVESLSWDQVDAAIKAVRSHPRVFFVWECDKEDRWEPVSQTTNNCTYV